MAKFDYHWRKSINITAWVLQIVVCVILLAASAWVLAFLSSYADDYDLGSYSGLVNGAAGIQIAITSLTIIFDIAEIVLIAKDRMPPALYLSSACVKTGIWGVIFILDLVSLSVLAIILTLILFKTSTLQLVYGAIVVHRQRKGTLRGGSYAPAQNNPFDDPTHDQQPATAAAAAAYDVPPPPQQKYGLDDVDAGADTSYYAPQTQYRPPTMTTTAKATTSPHYEHEQPYGYYSPTQQQQGHHQQKQQQQQQQQIGQMGGYGSGVYEMGRYQ